MQTLWQDLRYGARMLVKNPGFTLLALMTLALGVGANTAIFSVVNAVLLRPLPYADPSRLVMLWEERPERGIEQIVVGGHEYPEWKRQNQSFEQMAAMTWSGAVFNLTGKGEPATVTGPRVSAGFFPLMGVQPLLGRAFLPEEDRPGGGRVVILSHSLWKNRFGRDAGVIGGSVTLNDQSYQIVGVMPPEFNFPLLPTSGEGPQLWTPIAEPIEQYRGRHFLIVIGRLKAGVTLAQAQTEMDTIAARLEREQQGDRGHGVSVIELNRDLVKGVRKPLFVLLGAVGFVLLIGCVNVANLLLVRSAGRSREIAVRAALGAGRLRLIRQLFTESLLLAMIGGGAGLLLAYWMLDLLIASSPINIPRLTEANMDGRVLAMTTGLTALTAVIFGLVPAIQSSRVNVNAALKAASPAIGTRGALWFRNTLVVAELALAVTLLIGAGLMIRSFSRLMKVDLGFDAENVISMDVSLPNTRYPKPHQKTQFFEQLSERIKATPGVLAVGASNGLPLSGVNSTIGIGIEGRPPAPPGEESNVQYRVVSHDYFKALRIPLRLGRSFTPGDARLAVPLIRWYPQQPVPSDFDKPQAAPVVVVNETLARRYWLNEDPLGKRIRVIFSPWLTVVGVVGDTRQLGVTETARPELYFLDLQEPQGMMSLVVRASGDPANLTTTVREHIWALDKDLPVTHVRKYSEFFSDSVAQRRFNTILLGVFAAVALLLATIGVYGVMNYSVSQQFHEIGVRMALGARAEDVLTLIVRQSLKLILIGAALGVTASFALTRLISGLLFEVQATDPMTFLLIPAILMGVMLAASLIPARRATRVDPMIALRSD
jgi:putative ABC transport system permease protein